MKIKLAYLYWVDENKQKEKQITALGRQYLRSQQTAYYVSLKLELECYLKL